MPIIFWDFFPPFQYYNYYTYSSYMCSLVYMHSSSEYMQRHTVCHPNTYTQPSTITIIFIAPKVLCKYSKRKMNQQQQQKCYKLLSIRVLRRWIIIFHNKLRVLTSNKSSTEKIKTLTAILCYEYNV